MISTNKTRKNGYPRLGEVYYIEFSGRGSVQRGRRPAIIFQNNTGNFYSPNITVIPLTTVRKKMKQPTHVYLPSHQTGLPADSVALCENMQCVSKEEIEEYITTIPQEYMTHVARGQLLASSAIAYLDCGDFDTLRAEALKLNYTQSHSIARA